MEEFSTFTVLKDKETDFTPFPDFVKLDNVGMIQLIENVDLILKCLIVLDLILLNSLDSELISGFPMLS